MKKIKLIHISILLKTQKKKYQLNFKKHIIIITLLKFSFIELNCMNITVFKL